MAIHLTDRTQIVEELKGVSSSIVSYIYSNPYANYQLFSKEITHSDLCGGKRIDKSQGNEKNILYYLTIREMEEMGGTPVARQSNLSIPSPVYEALGIDAKKHVVIGFKLVNDSTRYFAPEYSIRVVQNLGKTFPWNSDKCVYVADDGPFTSMHMTYGDQGVGTSNDPEFQSLRKNIFVDDVVYFLVEELNSNKNLYILLSKAEKFYEVLNLPRTNREQIEHADIKTAVTEVRTEQDIWKDRLAEEMMQHTSSDTHVFCPLSRISAVYEDFKMMFIASHIKAYANCEEHEKYDVNNGLLLYAGTDALFDKYMITIGEDKEIIFSYLIDDDLKRELQLDRAVYKPILNPQRMEYMKEHRRIFLEKEIERRNKRQQTGTTTVTSTDADSKAAGQTVDEICVTLKREELQGACLPSGGSETYLIAPYDNILHKRWIIRNKMFNSLITKIDMPGASVNSCPDIIILYDRYNVENYTAYGVRGCDYVEGNSMTGSPQTIDGAQSYLIFRIGSERQVNVDVKMLLHHVASECSVEPTSKLILINN